MSETPTRSDEPLGPVLDAITVEAAWLEEQGFDWCDQESVRDAWTDYADMKEQFGKLCKQIEEQLTAWLDANGRVQIGEKRWLYAGVSKRTVCTDPGGLLLFLVKEKRLRPSQVANCLSSDPWKTGPLREHLAADYGDWFEARRQTKPAEGGKKAADNAAEELRVRPLVHDERFGG